MQRAESLSRARARYDLARLIAWSFHRPDDMPLFEELYPDLEDVEDTENTDSGWLLIREQMRSAADYNNAKWSDRA